MSCHLHRLNAVEFCELLNCLLDISELGIDIFACSLSASEFLRLILCHPSTSNVLQRLCCCERLFSRVFYSLYCIYCIFSFLCVDISIFLACVLSFVVVVFQ